MSCVSVSVMNVCVSIILSSTLNMERSSLHKLVFYSMKGFQKVKIQHFQLSGVGAKGK